MIDHYKYRYITSEWQVDHAKTEIRYYAVDRETQEITPISKVTYDVALNKDAKANVVDWQDAGEKVKSVMNKLRRNNEQGTDKYLINAEVYNRYVRGDRTAAQYKRMLQVIEGTHVSIRRLSK